MFFFIFLSTHMIKKQDKGKINKRIKRELLPVVTSSQITFVFPIAHIIKQEIDNKTTIASKICSFVYFKLFAIIQIKKEYVNNVKKLKANTLDA